MVARGTIVLDAGNKTLTILKESVSIMSGLKHTNLPASPSSSAFQAAVMGRAREVIIEGIFSGTQAEIEAWLEYFEDWTNPSGLSFQETGQYYPLHHKSNQVNGSQANYWNVMANNFTWAFDLSQPTRINYTLVMREGSKVGLFASTSGES